MEVFQWIVYLIHLLFFNVGWIYGCRRLFKTEGGFTYHSGSGTLFLTIASIIFLTTSINKFHLLWITPLISYTAAPIAGFLFSIPIIGGIYLQIVKVFTNVITIGVKTNKNYFDILRKEGKSEEFINEYKRRLESRGL